MQMLRSMKIKSLKWKLFSTITPCSKVYFPSGLISCNSTTTADSQKNSISIWTLRSKKVLFLTLTKNLRASLQSRTGKLTWNVSNRRSNKVKMSKTGILKKYKSRKTRRNYQTRNLMKKMRSTWTKRKKIGYGQDESKRFLQKLESLRNKIKVE